MAIFQKNARAKARVQVVGHKELDKLFRQLPEPLVKKYMGQTVTKVAAKVRKDARKLAPVGKRTGTTEMKSAKEQATHRVLKKHIRSGKLKRRPKSTVKRSVYGPRQANPLLSGHKLVAWGRPTGQTVKPSYPFLDEAREKHRATIRNEGAKLIREFISKDAVRMGKRQAAATLSKTGQTRLSLLGSLGFTPQSSVVTFGGRSR